MRRYGIPAAALRLATAAFGLVLAAGAATAVEWKLGHILPPDHPSNRALEAAAKEIAERTQGRIEIKVFPAGQIGNAKENLTAITLGSSQMAFDGFGILSQWNKRLSVVEAPYLVKDFEHLKRIVASPEGQKLVDELRQKSKIRILDVWYYGSRHVTNNKRAINAVEDMAGIKLRVPEIQLSLEWAKAMGMTPAPMAFPELYLGLQTGVVDGQENPLPTINAAKFYEVQKHLALTAHLVQSVSPLVSEDVWQAASEADRAVVLEVMRKAGETSNAEIVRLEQDLVKTLEAKGMQVTRPDPAPMRARMVPVAAKFEETWGKGVYAALAAVP
ncbi:sialic acid TRAP transporter substrate-binding protein SiaP [Prosthecomicrobium sp. N25]|uniref:sialic acid TRAP transporter substrate-binding protein SiaP n=1 Tax=Prosthecomicrobium sp. N25 TaxID=3129254 RepID=UPI0030784722